MTVTRHLKKITSFLSFSFAASPAGRDFPHADDALLRPPPRVAERREVLLNKSKTFFKNALQTLPFIHGDCTETVKTLRKTWRSFETSTNFPRGVNTAALFLFFSVSQTCCLDIALLLDNFQSAANDISPKRNVIEDRSTALN